VTTISRVVRLAVGIQVVDAVRGDPADVQIAWENVPKPVAPVIGGGFPPAYDVGVGLPRLRRGSRPGLFSVAFTPEVTPTPPARTRIIDGRRRYVPRRLVIPYADLAQVLAEETAGGRPAARGRTVGVFPGAAFPAEGASTGIRGRAVDSSGIPVRWVRAEARHPIRGTVLGYAHGDDRGEFLLLLDTPPTSLDKPDRLAFDVRVVVSARPVGAVMAPPLTGDPLADPLGDLLPEVLPDLGTPDVISPGDTTPAGYSRTTAGTVTCILGRLVSPAAAFELP
jgi:hypothetical protein